MPIFARIDRSVFPTSVLVVAYGIFILWRGIHCMPFFREVMVAPNQSVDAGLHLSLLILAFANAGMVSAVIRRFCDSVRLSSSRSRYFRV